MKIGCPQNGEGRRGVAQHKDKREREKEGGWHKRKGMGKVGEDREIERLQGGGETAIAPSQRKGPATRICRSVRVFVWKGKVRRLGREQKGQKDLGI